jgi:U3 small nucleolar RNA-associated protein 18
MSFMTKRWIGNFSVNRGVIDMAWSRNGHHLYVLNSEAEVYCWDVTTFRCIHRFRDYGGVAPTALAISPNDHYFAIGSNSGIVNVYDHSVNDTHEPKPIKVLDQITTPISGLKFSHDEQILCIYSHVVKDRLRMVGTICYYSLLNSDKSFIYHRFIYLPLQHSTTGLQQIHH